MICLKLISAPIISIYLYICIDLLKTHSSRKRKRCTLVFLSIAHNLTHTHTHAASKHTQTSVENVGKKAKFARRSDSRRLRSGRKFQRINRHRMGQQGPLLLLLLYIDYNYMLLLLLLLLQAWVRRFLRFCALLSLVSVCLNTPSTFNKFPYLIYITFICDAAVTVFFTAEMIAKIHIKNIFNYVRDRWSLFDAIMVIFHWISLVIHVLR